MNSLFRSAEQEYFSKLVAAHLTTLDKPLLAEGTTGLGKTRAYLVPIMEAAQSGKSIAIILPTHQLIEQLLSSADLKACLREGVTIASFLPGRFFDDTITYLAHKEVALTAGIMICTSASVIIDQRLNGGYNGVTKRDYLLFDEADQLPDVAALQSDRAIAGYTLKELGVKTTSAEETANAVIAKTRVEPETRAAAKLILEAIDSPAWYHTAGVTDDGGIALHHRLPGRLLKKIANQPNAAFISATLTIGGKFDDFRRALGIEEVSRFSGAVEPKVHGELHFHLDTNYPVNSAEWLDQAKLRILEAKRPTLVVTPSHELAVQLAESNTEATLRNKEETTADAALRMGDSTLLIAAGAWAGLDTVMRWSSVVVPRIPFPNPTVLDDKVEGHYLNSRNSAIRRMRQVIGRGLRTPEAVCHIYILDPRWGQIESFVPERFRAAWRDRSVEGGRVEVTLSRAERDPYWRKTAIKHYGLQCLACGFTPRTANQIEVHHQHPISEGERQTTIDDLAPLCANCHRLAHSETPPITLTALKAISAD